MHPRYLQARALIVAAAASVLLAACAGGGSALTPSTGLSPAGHPAAQAHAMIALDEHRGGGDDGGGSGGAMTFTLVNGLSSDSALNLNIASKGCDATLADAPTYTISSFTSLTLPKLITLNDCASSTKTLATTTDYVVLVDLTKANAMTAIAGPATETVGVLSFPPIVSAVPLVKGDTYAFFIATGSAGSGNSCSDGDKDHRRGDSLRANDRDKDKWGDCKGDGDHRGDGDGDHHGDGDH